MAYNPRFTEGPENKPLNEWLTTHTWITWYIRDGQGNLRLVWDPKLHEVNTKLKLRWQGYGSRRRETSAHGNSEQPLTDRYLREIRDECHNLPRDEFKETMPKYPYQVRMVKPGQRSTRSERLLEDQRFLQFWTWSTHLFVWPEDPEQPFSKKPRREATSGNSTPRRYWMSDCRGDFAGTLMLDKAWETLANGVAGKAKPEIPFEFIAISEAFRFEPEEYDEWNHAEPRKKNSAEWFCYNVVLLVYDDDIRGVARRAGLGKVYKSLFDEDGMNKDGTPQRKEWKEIILG